MSENFLDAPESHDFPTFVTSRLCPAIRQVIEASYAGAKAPAGLFAAILMIYTEVLGQAMLGTLGDHHKGKRAAEGGFKKFLGEMGPEYLQFKKTWDNAAGQSLYDAFRNGLVHQLTPKVPTTIHFKNDAGVIKAHGHPAVSIPKPVTCGIGRISDGYYYLVIEKYLDDFEDACDRLFAQYAVQHGNHQGGAPSTGGSDSDETPLLPGIQWIPPGTSSPETP